MEIDKNDQRDEKKEEGAAKRRIGEVEDGDNNINEGAKRVKSEIHADSDCTSVDQVLVTNDIGDETSEQVQDEDGGEKKGESIEVVKPKINYSKKKKCVLLLSYCGAGYSGMQRNPGVKTIEEDLTNALRKARAISEDAFINFGKMSFQRCARTDKGVSAARQVVSLKHMVPYKELLPEINNNLEPQIRVFAMKQVTRGFDCKSRCSSRVYEYLLPTFAFAPNYAHTTEDFRVTNEIINELDDLLKNFVGTKNFHNFTSGKAFKEESAKRYIIKFHVAGQPFVKNKLEFLVLRVQGQSFMQHQIRKMIGLVIAIMKRHTGLDAVNRSFQEPKMDIPRAPGLGLILDQVHFNSYNKRFGVDGIHESLEWSECEDQIEEFKKKFIYSPIIETEASNRSMMRWLGTLSTHTYNNEGMVELQRNRDPTDISTGTFTETQAQEKTTELATTSKAEVKKEVKQEEIDTSVFSSESILKESVTSSHSFPMDSSELEDVNKPTDENVSLNSETVVKVGVETAFNHHCTMDVQIKKEPISEESS